MKSVRKFEVCLIYFSLQNMSLPNLLGAYTTDIFTWTLHYGIDLTYISLEYRQSFLTLLFPACVHS